MYIHMGKDKIINDIHIIGIFDITKLEKKVSLEEICKNLDISDKIIDISDGIRKTLILISDNKKHQINAYISNISSVTIAKRTQIRKLEISKSKAFDVHMCKFTL